jgi:hypothetical protein
MSDPSCWRSLHVHRHDGRFTDLVLDAVRPLFGALPGRVRAYHLPHWRQGPHLRLNMYADDATFATVVRPLVDELVGGWIATHPSTVDTDPAASLADHQRLARLEADSGPLLPWLPDNSVTEQPYDARTDVLGGPAAAHLLADMHVATTDLAFALTARLRRGGQLTGIAFDLLVATAHALSGLPLAEGFVSYRSHAEGFLASSPDGAALRSQWDLHRARHAATLRDRVRRTVDAVDTGSGYAADWVRMMTPIRARAGELIADHRLVLDTDWIREHYDPGIRLDTTRSAFHATLASQGRDGNVGARADWFQQYRVMLNYLYLFLTRVGLRPGERYLVCHLVAGAVEDAYGVSALDVIGRPTFAAQAQQ